MINCVPDGSCSCDGHRIPHVYHVAPCCDKPHVDSYVDDETFNRLLDKVLVDHADVLERLKDL